MSVFWLVGRDSVGFYHSGVSQEMLGRYQWNALLVKEGIEIARHRGASHLDLLRGEEEYKLRWASAVIPSRRAVLGRNPLTWAPYAAYISFRARVERYVFSVESPPWIRQTMGGGKRAVALLTQVVNSSGRNS